jgi:DNA-binding protein H-NS
MRLTAMSVDKLLSLREEIGAELVKRAAALKKDLDTLDGDSSHRSSSGNGRRVSLKGTKIKPKYRGPKGETWAGRGVLPRWLVALREKGRNIERYRIKE